MREFERAGGEREGRWREGGWRKIKQKVRKILKNGVYGYREKEGNTQRDSGRRCGEKRGKRG